MIIVGTIIECIYLYFMFTKFKTTLTCNHPLEYIMIRNLGKYFEHPISNTEYSNKICPFGKTAIQFLILYLVVRMFIIKLYPLVAIKKFNFYILIITLIISLMNMNALLYLVPFFIFDIYMLNKIV